MLELRASRSPPAANRDREIASNRRGIARFQVDHCGADGATALAVEVRSGRRLAIRARTSNGDGSWITFRIAPTARRPRDCPARGSRRHFHHRFNGGGVVDSKIDGRGIWTTTPALLDERGQCTGDLLINTLATGGWTAERRRRRRPASRPQRGQRQHQDWRDDASAEARGQRQRAPDDR